MKDFTPLIPLLVITLLFWLFLVRPATRQRKQAQALQASLTPGDKVMLTSGIYGQLVSLTDSRVRIEVSPGVVIEVARAAVASVERADDIEAAEAGSASGLAEGDVPGVHDPHEGSAPPAEDPRKG